MKKKFVAFSLCIACLFAAPYTAEAQRFVVKVRPTHHRVAVVRPIAPSPRHIWIDDEWVWDARRGEYIVVAGYWAAPKFGHVWVPGHWKDTRRGSYWVAGHWRRV